MKYKVGDRIQGKYNNEILTIYSIIENDLFPIKTENNSFTYDYLDFYYKIINRKSKFEEWLES